MKTGCCNSNYVYHTGGNAVCLNECCSNYLGKTTLHRDLSSWKKPVVVSLIAFQLMFGMEDISMANQERSMLNMRFSAADTPLSIENLKAELEKQKILCSNEVLAQMKLESANLSSELLQKTNNLMGMRFPFSRNTAACGLYIPSLDKIVYGDKQSLKKYAKLSNYAVYSCWQDAVADYKLWQTKSNFKVTERYLSYLGQVYAEDQAYVSKIKNMTSAK